ncbi:hypothetical protein JCM8202v2_005545 [Rhodotorula sphaerocarpa]
MSSSKDELRRQLNLKNLQRHDPSIDRIVASTSYASIYDNNGSGWVKTGVEGPMFLFSRTTAPHYGFFVLNRNGLEYVQEFLTPESEVQVGGEFILYESGRDAGIWVFEEKERHELCRQMEQVRARAATSEGAKATAPGIPRGQPISLDMLFSAASPTPASAVLPGPASAQTGAPAPVSAAARSPAAAAMNPLDALFASATRSPRPAPARAAPPAASAASPVAAQRLPPTLEQLFAAASPTPQAAQLPLPPPQQQQQQPPTGGMALLDSIFANAAQNSSPRPAAMRPPPPPAAAAGSYPAPPQAQQAPLPYSPQTQSAMRPSVSPAPTSPPAPQPPRDARDLLAMLGGIASPSAPLAVQPSPAMSAPAMTSLNGPEPASAAPVENSPPTPRPQTTLHPQGLSMDPQPGPIASEEVVTVTSPSQPSAALSPTADEGSNKVAEARPEAPAKSDAAPPTMFAPPLLSHDIFAALPVPGTKAAKEAPTAATPSAGPSQGPDSNSAQGPNGRADSSSPSRSHPTTSLASEAAAPVPVAAVTSPTEPRKNPSLLLGKSELVAAVDAAVAEAAVGMSNGVGNGAEGPMRKEDFVAKVMEVVQKPSFVMQLYGRYLERYEEAHE